MEGSNEKKVGEIIAKAFGNEAFFCESVDFEKVGEALGCDPALVKLVNVILNQYGFEYIYEMTDDKQFILMDETNATGEYTPVPQSFEELCNGCVSIINQSLLNKDLTVEDVQKISMAKHMIENYIEESKKAKNVSKALFDFADWVSSCIVDNPQYYGKPEKLIAKWEESKKNK